MSLNEMSFGPVRMRGSSEESALAQALMIVGATRDQVQVEIVEQNEKGVTVRVSPRQNNAKNVAAQVEEAVAEVAGDDANDALTGAAEDQNAPESEAVAEDEDVSEDESATDESATDESATDENLTPIPQNDSSDYAASAAGDVEFEINPETIADVTTETEAAPVQEVKKAPSEPVSEESRERAGALAREMLGRMGLDTKVTVADGPFSSLEASDEDADSRVYLQVEGEDVGILIGKHGATLQSFQYLLNLSLNNAAHNARDNQDNAGDDNATMLRVVVDAGGYRAKRADMLEKSAQEGAERARRDRRSIRLEPMPAHERRLVHMALRDEAGLVTSSEGREPLRHVVISPEGMRPASNERGGGQNSRGNYRGGRSGGYNGGRDHR